MISHYILSFMLLLSHNLIHCASAAVHSHNIDTTERESDEAHRPEDQDVYSDSVQHNEFVHQAILGTVKEAEEYDKLSPEESTQRLSKLLQKMDLNGDNYIDRSELKKWILNSFIKLSKEQADERMSETDHNRDGIVTWLEYMYDTFGVTTEEEASPHNLGESGMIIQEEKAMFAAADLNGDGKLDRVEFEIFRLLRMVTLTAAILYRDDIVVDDIVTIPLPSSVKKAIRVGYSSSILTTPEEHELMHPFMVQQTLREKDENNDGHIDYKEYLGERSSGRDKSCIIAQKEKFDNKLDVNKDGRLDLDEIKKWIIPDNDVIAEEEVNDFFDSADDDIDNRLSYGEVLEHHELFVGSKATAYGNDLMRSHLNDEL